MLGSFISNTGQSGYHRPMTWPCLDRSAQRSSRAERSRERPKDQRKSGPKFAKSPSPATSCVASNAQYRGSTPEHREESLVVLVIAHRAQRVGPQDVSLVSSSVQPFPLSVVVTNGSAEFSANPDLPLSSALHALPAGSGARRSGPSLGHLGNLACLIIARANEA